MTTEEPDESKSWMSLKELDEDSQLLERDAAGRAPLPAPLPQPLQGHLLFCSAFAALTSLAASPVGQVSSYATAFAGVAMPTAFRNYDGEGLAPSLRHLRDLCDCIALPSIAALMGMNDLLRPPTNRALLRELSHLCLAWLVTGSVQLCARSAEVPGSLHYAFSGDPARINMQKRGDGYGSAVPAFSHWVFAGQAITPLIALTACRVIFLSSGLVPLPRSDTRSARDGMHAHSTLHAGGKPPRGAHAPSRGLQLASTHLATILPSTHRSPPASIPPLASHLSSPRSLLARTARTRVVAIGIAFACITRLAFLVLCPALPLSATLVSSTAGGVAHLLSGISIPAV